MVGLGLVITGFFLWLGLLTISLRHGEDHPYIGLAMMGSGCLLILGMLLAPIGLYLGRRRLQRRLQTSLTNPAVAWTRFLVFLVITSLVNVLIASQAIVRVAGAMKTTQFCGSCHVMTPESRAFSQGPHAALQCVDCHVGDGAMGYLNSKLQGAKQLLEVLWDRVPKPIPGAVASGRMVPSTETCEACHWKDQPANATLKLIQRYAEDEANTPETTLLTMHVGGSRMGGIHGAHHGEGVEIRFVAGDPRRESFPLVEYRNERTGVSRTYVKAGSRASEFEGQPRITMQCFDCHNRAAHAFQMPDRAVDRALTLGRISASLPFLKKTAVKILRAEYQDSAAAAAAIPAALAEYYREAHPGVSRERASDIADAGAVLTDIYSRNVFPELGVTWGTYPDQSGHQTSPGCFRCHDGEHKTESGEAITKDCFRCHQASAVKETKPEILELLGVGRLLRGLRRK